jgi:hypothetical protein
MDNLELRRNGKFTCLDCQNNKSELCKTCKNWDQFDLNEEVSKLLYEEKSLKRDKK